MSKDISSREAQHVLIDPLVEPDPSDETGLNAHFGSTFAPAPHQQNSQLPTPPGSAGLKESPTVSVQHTGTSVETNPFRRSRASSASHRQSVGSHADSSRRYADPSPPYSPHAPRSSHSSHPRSNHSHTRSAQFSNHRSEAFGSMNESRPRRSSQPSDSPFRDSGISRSSSLRERYPGDPSVRPLDTIRRDTNKAHRAHHLRKKNFQGTDTIDRLDRSTLGYHHEGPYDAASLARNKDWKHSPVAAVKESNEEALKATPRENILDAVNKHRPLEGVANIPPGVPDRFGRVLDYREGADLQREPGIDAYRRWPGMDYHPDDLKGKGEPSFTVDTALKNHKLYGEKGSEMQSRRRNQSLGDADAPESVPLQSGFEQDGDVARSNSTGRGVGGALRKRFGSLRRRKETAA